MEELFRSPTLRALLVFAFKNLPKISSNEIYAGKHWSARKKLKDQFLWLTIGIKGRKSFEQIVDLEFIFYFKSKPLDSSNTSYMAKILEDCLVSHGILLGDDIKHVRKISLESRKGENDFCEIRILPTAP